MKKIAVLYLCRKGNPEKFSRRFLQSLVKHRAGAEYDLVYILKGFEDAETDAPFVALRPKLPCDSYEIRVSDEGFDIGAYMKAAAQLTQEFVLPLNSYAQILADDWLQSFVHAFDTVEDCTIAGATGSFEQIKETPDFPNIHIRTTGFFISRALFLSVEKGALTEKYENNLFEAGPNSLTKQIAAQGKKAVVVGRQNQIWHPKDWPQSRTFRSGEQENLLIADNRTYHYASSHHRRRRRLAKRAWGETSMASKPNPFSRLKRICQWKWG